MITVFNRRLILQTYNITEVEQLTLKLERNGIGYKVKTQIPNFRTPFGGLKAMSQQQMSSVAKVLYRVYIARESNL